MHSLKCNIAIIASRDARGHNTGAIVLHKDRL